jgi:hypothetical protein
MVEQFANNPSSTLNGNITSVATSILVTNGTPFSSTGTYRVIVDSEIMLVTARSGNTLTVTRGQEGTTAASHLDTTLITQIMTAGAIQQFRSDNIQASAIANLPAAGTAGRIYTATDGNMTFFDNGVSWLATGPVMRLTQPPAASNFTIFQTGSNGILSDDGGGLFFSALQRVTTEDSIFAAQSNPGGTGASYTLTVGFIHLPGGKNGTGGYFNYHICGIGIYNTSTTQARYLTMYTDSGGALHFQLSGKTGLVTTAGAATFDVGGYPTIAGPMSWFRIQDDGATNRTYFVSNDGRHFKPVTIEARTLGFTSQPDKIGLYLNPFNADAAMTVLSYTLTSP